MIAVISPAKTLDFSTQSVTDEFTLPVFLDEASQLAEKLKGFRASRLAKLMSVNSRLAQLNFERYQEWSLPFNKENSKQALFSFRGDVYLGIDAPGLSAEDVDFAQGFLRILSGLYGILKPLDLIKPYRLEMGVPIKVRRKSNLYQYWGDKLAGSLREEFGKDDDPVLINLASKEYFRALEDHLEGIRVITPVFKDFKDGQYRFIHVYGKKARGLMTRFIIDRRIEDPEAMKLFDYDGYFYNDRLSKGDEWVFTRG